MGPPSKQHRGRGAGLGSEPSQLLDTVRRTLPGKPQLDDRTLEKLKVRGGGGKRGRRRRLMRGQSCSAPCMASPVGPADAPPPSTRAQGRMQGEASRRRTGAPLPRPCPPRLPLPQEQALRRAAELQQQAREGLEGARKVAADLKRGDAQAAGGGRNWLPRARAADAVAGRLNGCRQAVGQLCGSIRLTAHTGPGPQDVG